MGIVRSLAVMATALGLTVLWLTGLLWGHSPAVAGTIAAVNAVVNAAAVAQAEPLRVVVTAAPPYVITEDERLTGFSIDLWEAIAARSGVEFVYVPVDDVPGQLAQLTSGAADVAVSALSITQDRIGTVEFSVPYEQAGLQIMVREGGDARLSLLEALRTSLSPSVLRIMAVFLGLIFLAANVTWLVDRKTNDDFPRPYLRGMWEAIWWSTVTITTVGYGDKTPKSFAGRIVGLVWMLMGLFLVAHFTASMTTAMSVSALQNRIQGLSDLNDVRIATVAGTSAEEFLVANRLQPALLTTSIDEALDALLAREADAVMYDGPILQYFAHTDGAGRVLVLPHRFDTEFYAMALPLGSPHRHAIDGALLDLMEDGTYDQIRRRWLGSP